MKKIIFICTIMGAMTFASCSQDTLEPNQQNETNLTVSTANTSGPIATCSNYQSTFETQLQWVSYVTAKTLTYTGNDFISDFSGYLTTNNTDRIALSKLIGPNTIFPDFDHSFETTMIGWYIGPGNPDTENNLPGIPVIPDPFTELTTQEKYDLFVNIMLNDNCVELYFPSGLTTGVFQNETVELTSTAHPLNSNSVNNAYKRKARPTSNFHAVDAVCVNENYVNSNINNIIARPVRSWSSGGCSYPEYPGINFNTFPY